MHLLAHLLQLLLPLPVELLLLLPESLLLLLELLSLQYCLFWSCWSLKASRAACWLGYYSLLLYITTLSKLLWSACLLCLSQSFLLYLSL